MHFHLFPPPPPMPLMPIVLTAALAFAAGLFVMCRGIPQLVADVRGFVPDRLAFWRRRSDGTAARFESLVTGNTAFEDYKRTTLAKLEGEAQEFRTFLDGLRRSADAADFQAFLQSRRDVKAIR